MISFNTFHPNAVYLDKKTQDIVCYIEKIKLEYPLKDIIVWLDSDDEYEKFLQLGFEECRRTYDLEIEVSSLLNVFKEVDGNSEQIEDESFIVNKKLVNKWYEVYASTHKANPVKPCEFEGMREVIGKDLDYKNSILILNRKDEICGYIFVYEADEETVEIGYMYYQDNIAKQCLKHLLFKRLTNVDNKNIKRVYAEVDDTDQYAYEFLKEFLSDNPPFQRTLIYKRSCCS